MSDNSSFTSHFVELRSRLIKSLIFIFVIFVISYTFAEQIYNFLVEPYANAVKKLYSQLQDSLDPEQLEQYPLLKTYDNVSKVLLVIIVLLYSCFFSV